MPNRSPSSREQLGMLINLWPEEFRELEALYGETISAKMLKNVVKFVGGKKTRSRRNSKAGKNPKLNEDTNFVFKMVTMHTEH